MAYVTKTPTGLQIDRNGNEFTFSWTIRDADHGMGQIFNYRTSAKDVWHPVVITERQTSVKLTLNPINITRLSFRVLGKRSPFTQKNAAGKNVNVVPAVSAWAVKDGGWIPAKPTKPEIEYDMTSSNSGTFNVKHDADDDGTRVVEYVQYATCTSTSSADPPKKGWGSVTNVNGRVDVDTDVSFTEETEAISKTGVVRWFRARCKGPGGTTSWVYSHHAYSFPNKPALASASAKTLTSRSATSIKAKWKSKESLKHPIDEEILQYVIDSPINNSCSAPATGWSDAMSVTPSGKKDIVTAYVSDMTSMDQCMWVRVAAVHDDDYIKYSKTIRVIEEELAAPDISASVNYTTGDVTVSLTINSECPVARHAIFYRKAKKSKKKTIVAIMSAGETTRTINIPALIGESRSIIGAYAFVGKVSGLSVDAIMTSDIATDGDVSVKAPYKPVIEQLDNTSVYVNFGTLRWGDAESIEIGYADNKYAWQSNEQPKTCMCDDVGVRSWVVQGLDVGKVWYFRTRYHGMEDGEEVVSDWSNMGRIDLATNPEQPTLNLNSGFVLPGGSVSASWDYVNEDESPQDSAQICLANVSGSTVTYGRVLTHANTERNALIRTKWTAGTQYYLACRVRAASGLYSDWSDPVGLYVPTKPSLTLSGTAISDGVMTALGGTVVVNLYTDSAPGRYSLSIIREKDYHIARPDDGIYDGYEGETIWSVSDDYAGGTSSATYTISKDDLIGALDDGARYRLIAVLTDDYGQSSRKVTPFRVNWAHKSSIAKPVVVSDARLLAVRIMPVQPEGYVAGDTFDIYRITVDQPELIVRDGSYGTTYVDPYPAFGPLCGHRVVAKTATGSYVTEDGGISWYDLGLDDGDNIACNDLIIDANGTQIRLPYNIELSNRWQKDFIRTSYLGGSVRGDWNPAVLRDLTAKTVIVRDQDTGELMDMRDLAAYAGPAHIRTPDGSSFSCDIQVAEDTAYNDSKITYSLTIKGINAQEPDGMTLAQWRALHPVG